MTEKYIKSMKDIDKNPELLGRTGGKFYGLYKIRELIAEIRQESGLDISIPQTYVMGTEAFEAGTAKVSEKMLDEAMGVLEACGGCVAVRSSADAEDKGGSTNSGMFESVLNVRNREEMKQALETVYRSAERVPEAKMAIVFQPMIETPVLAGVAYSEDFNGDPFVAINCVENKIADKLLLGEEGGTIIKCSKDVRDSNKDSGVPLEPFMLTEKSKRFAPYYKVYNFGCEFCAYMSFSCMEKMPLFKESAKIAAVCAKLERELGYPVDMEFALDRNGTLNILQQRPYLAKGTYKVMKNSYGDYAGYVREEGNLVFGEVLTSDAIDIFEKGEKVRGKNLPDFDGRIFVARKAKPREGMSEQDFCAYERMSNEVALFNLTSRGSYNEKRRAKLKIDTLGYLYSCLYGHQGNELRERGEAFLIAGEGRKFEEVQNGDYMQINLETGEYKIWQRSRLLKKLPQKAPYRKQNLVSESIKNLRYGRS